MIRTTELSIHGAQTECDYRINPEGKITGLLLYIKGEKVQARDLLNIPAVYEALEAHHCNLLEEDNA
jgi:hypothetical protein